VGEVFFTDLVAAQDRFEELFPVVARSGITICLPPQNFQTAWENTTVRSTILPLCI